MIPTMFNDLQPSAGQSQPPADAFTAASIPVTAFTPTQIQKWELGVALILHTWRALSDAVASGWGGPESSDKRDWLCGAIAEMFEKDPETDEYDVETTLAGVMEDEFELALEDDSAYEIAKRIMLLKEKVAREDYAEVDEMHKVFLEKQARGAAAGSKPVVQEVDQEVDEDEEDEDEDMEMGDAPAQAPAPRERQEPVIDEDGFELVQKKGRR